MNQRLRTASIAIAALMSLLIGVVFPHVLVSANGSEGHLSYPGVVADTVDWRAVDTRQSSNPALHHSGPLRSGQVLTEYLGDFGGFALTITAVNAPRAGYLRAYPCSVGSGGTAILNFGANEVVSNSVFVESDSAGRVCVQAMMPGASDSQRVHVVMDVNALLPGTAVDSPQPKRIYDSRDHARLRQGAVLTLSGQSYARIYAFNLAAVAPDYDGVFTVYPCRAGRSSAHSVAYEQGKVSAGSVLVRPDLDGKVCIYTSRATHIVIDRTGRIETQNTVMLPKPQLLVSSASGLGLDSPGRSTNFRFQLPADFDGRTALLLVHASNASSQGYIGVTSCNERPGATSNLNYDTKWIGITYAFVAPSPTREVCITSRASVHVTVFLAGYFNQRRSTSLATAGCPAVDKIVWLSAFDGQIGCFQAGVNNADGSNQYNTYLVNRDFGFYWTLEKGEVVHFDRWVQTIEFLTDAIVCCGYGISPAT